MYVTEHSAYPSCRRIPVLAYLHDDSRRGVSHSASKSSYPTSSITPKDTTRKICATLKAFHARSLRCQAAESRQQSLQNALQIVKYSARGGLTSNGQPRIKHWYYSLVSQTSLYLVSPMLTRLQTMCYFYLLILVAFYAVIFMVAVQAATYSIASARWFRQLFAASSPRRHGAPGPQGLATGNINIGDWPVCHRMNRDNRAVVLVSSARPRRAKTVITCDIVRRRVLIEFFAR